MVTIHRRRPNGGFTVVEVLLAIAVFSIVIPVIVLGVVTLTQINQNAINLTYANIIAENKIETLRSIGYNSVAIGSTNFASELPITFGTTKTATYTVAAESTGVKSIVVSISYKALNRTVTLNYKTLVSELGVGQ
jgi:prepilin-type N-terminal cleavage/methylation domain-containing protein